MKIILAENSDAICENFVHHVNALEQVQVVWTGPHSAKVTDIARQTQSDVVLLNVSVSQASQNGLAFEVLMELDKLNPRPFIVMLGDRTNKHYDEIYAREALKRGADRYWDRTLIVNAVPELVERLQNR